MTIFWIISVPNSESKSLLSCDIYIYVNAIFLCSIWSFAMWLFQGTRGRYLLRKQLDRRTTDRVDPNNSRDGFIVTGVWVVLAWREKLEEAVITWAMLYFRAHYWKCEHFTEISLQTLSNLLASGTPHPSSIPFLSFGYEIYSLPQIHFNMVSSYYTIWMQKKGRWKGRRELCGVTGLNLPVLHYNAREHNNH